MNKVRIKIKTLSIFFVWILLCAVFAVFVNISNETAGAEIWIVDQAGGGNFTTIQDAINNSSDGDTIYVWAGTYYENVIVNKTVSLIGNGTSNTIIDGSDSGNVVEVISDWVNITGFTLTNTSGSGIYLNLCDLTTIYANNITSTGRGIRVFDSCYNNISGNDISHNDYGIDLTALSGTFNNTIQGNDIHSNTDFGIYLFVANDNEIKDNFIYENNEGITLNWSFHNTISKNEMQLNTYSGIYFTRYSDNNIISGNNISGSIHGIFSKKYWPISHSWYNTISNNTIFDNVNGLTFLYIDSNTIANNNISSNTDYGFNLTGCYDNDIYHNHILGNTNQAFDNATNNWNLSYPGGGNYWDDWTLPNDDGDRWVDIPRDIDGGANQDMFPWADPYGWTLPSAKPVQNLDTGEYFGSIQNAIDDPDTLNGHTIWAAIGRYYENVLVNKTLTLMGEDRESTVIDGGGVDSTVTVESNWVNITGFKITNGGTSTPLISGIYIETVGNCTIENNNISGNGLHGITLWSSSDNTILSNIMSGNMWRGLWIKYSQNNIISDNDVLSNAGQGVTIDNCEDSIISENDFISNGVMTLGYGIECSNSNNISIWGNNIFSNTELGIYILSVNNNTISGNNITSNLHDGLFLYRSSNNTISGNNISNNALGIYLDDYCVDNIITGNDITSNSDYGIRIQDYSNNNNIIGNLILDNSGGIHIFRSCNDNSILGNEITLNNGNGIYLQGEGSPPVSDNIISGNNITLNTNYGIYFRAPIAGGWDTNTVSNNNIIGNAYGIYLEALCDANTIFSNNITSNTNYGLYLTGSDSNEIYHNNIIDNTNQAFDDGTNFWNLPYPGGGNYWNDYTGKDIFSGVNQDILGSDGFGDTPYDIAGGGGERDYYPLVRPSGTPSAGNIFITSHKDGEYVGGTIVIEAVVTFADISGVNFYVNGMPMFFDDSHPYQFILDTTTLPEDAGFDLRAEAVLFYGYPVPTSITLYVNNIVNTGSYISVSTLNSEYQPDEDVSVLVSMVSPPAFESLELEVNCVDPSGHPLYTSAHSFPYGTEFRVIMSLPSDAELGTYTVSVEAIGFVDDSMVWSATDSAIFLVSGMSLRDQLEELNQTISGLNVTAMIATLDQLNQNLSSLDLTELLDTINFLNQTLPVKIDDLSLQLSGVNDSLQSSISSAEINLLNELAGVNATLANDIQNLLASITTDIIGMNSSLADQLTNLLNTMTTDSDALRTWLDIVLGAIDTNLTDTRAVLETQLADLDDYMAGFNDSLKSDLGGIIGDIQAHDSNTGQNHSDIIDMLGSLQGDLGEIDIADLKTMLSDLTGNVSTFDQSIAADIQQVVDDITEFETGSTQRLDNISNTLDDLARWEDVLSKLEELDSDLDTAEDELSASIDKIPTEKEEGFGAAEGLLIVVIILLIIILLVMLMGRKEKSSGIKAIPEEKIEPKTMELEEEEWEEPEEVEEEEPEEAEWEEVEETED
jgi:parallel beta-helix repeat protein